MAETRPRICVLGSINMDLQVLCDQLPGVGETMIANQASYVPGGKGANQAVAAARLGADVRMVGRVGDDTFAATLLESLTSAAVDVDGVKPTSACSSGLAVVAVDSDGENQIIVVPGANGCVSVADVEAAKSVIEASDMLLLQLEVPTDAVAAAIRIAKAAGVTTMLDPAPVPDEWHPAFNDVDILVPNRSEALAITGRKNDHDAAHELCQSTGGTIVVTLGDQGCRICTGTESQVLRSRPIAAVDSTGAGDAFAAAFGVHFSRFNDVDAAANFANASAALACTRRGAQSGLPTWDEVTGILDLSH
ncbi:MAG: ribokinase [Planctomycetaceae bacterium]